MNASIRYAGFWRRFGAYQLDNIIFFAFLCIYHICLRLIIFLTDRITMHYGIDLSMYLAILGGFFPYLGVLMWPLYFPIQWFSSKQATLGMRILGLKMVDYDHKRISMGRAFGRLLAVVVNVVTLYVGYFMVAFTKRKQGLHDMIAKTYVIRT